MRLWHSRLQMWWVKYKSTPLASTSQPRCSASMLRKHGLTPISMATLTIWKLPPATLLSAVLTAWCPKSPSSTAQTWKWRKHTNKISCYWTNIKLAPPKILNGKASWWLAAETTSTWLIGQRICRAASPSSDTTRESSNWNTHPQRASETPCGFLIAATFWPLKVSQSKTSTSLPCAPTTRSTIKKPTPANPATTATGALVSSKNHATPAVRSGATVDKMELNRPTTTACVSRVRFKPGGSSSWPS